MRRLVALLLALGLLAPAAAHAGGPRPRSRVVTYLRDGLVVSRLQADVDRDGHHLVGTMRATAGNTTGHAITRTLQVGRCTRGQVGAPICGPAVRATFTVPAHRRRVVVRGFRIRVPPPRQDSIEVSIVPPGTVSDRRLLLDANAELLLKGSAWRDDGRMRFGVDGLDGPAAARLAFDIPATSPTTSYMDVVWDGDAAPSRAATTLGHCDRHATCTDELLHPARGRSGPQQFGTRTDVHIGSSQALSLNVAIPGGPTLFRALLPWAG